MLSLSRVSKTYPGNVAALQDVNLEIPNGMFGLLGPNGAGKSTLMRTIATLQEPDEGAIHFDDIDVRKDKTALRRILGYLPQEFGSYPRTSAEAMLLHFAALKGIHGDATKASRRESVGSHQLVEYSQAQRRQVLRRHEAAIWYRSSAPWQSKADHRG